MRGLPCLLLFGVLGCRPIPLIESAGDGMQLAELHADQVVRGFRVEALYEGDGRALGARLVHEHTGFVLVPLRMQTVPQAWMWAETVPDSDHGEPHTQEHLLLGKGNKGRAVSTLEDLWLMGSSAYTEQIRTVYHFNTTAGIEVFFDGLEQRLDALLHPDYTDEEIRREVHHYGVSKAPDGTLALEEKGTVYNEMQSSFQRPWGRMWRAIEQTLYGEGHPLAVSSGGLPEAIREMKPEHIRDFHARTYRLGNMGALMVVPDGASLEGVLDRADRILRRLQPAPTPKNPGFVTEADLPPPEPAPAGTVVHTSYPDDNAAGPANVHLVWPATRDLPLADQLLADTLLDNLAGKESAQLYKVFVDGSTRERDIGATEVYAWRSDDLGEPIHVALGGIPAPTVDDELVAWVRDRVVQELRTIASLGPDDPALADLGRRARSSLVSWRRQLRKWISTPPGWGFRGTGSRWFDHLHSLDAAGGFHRSLTLTEELAAVEAKLDGPGNVWAEPLQRWGLLDVPPYVIVNTPSPALLTEVVAEREARLAAETEALVARTGASDAQQALATLAAEYDAATVELEALAAKAVQNAHFVDDPPMTLDDALTWTPTTVGKAAVPGLVATFGAMTGGDVRLYLDLDGVAPEHQPLLALFPDLLRRVGVIDDGTAVPYPKMIERLENEILDLDAGFSSEQRTDRLELAVGASGTDAAETAVAIGWIERILHHPDWRVANLPRLRDLVDERVDALARRTRGSEESWVNNPAAAWAFQDDPLQLRAWSFLTGLHDAHRLRWMLRDPGTPEQSARARRFLEDLATVGGDASRDGLAALAGLLQGREVKLPDADRKRLEPFVARAADLPDPVQAHLSAAARDLDRFLPVLPDGSLARDWGYLCRQMAGDLDTPPGDVLAELDALRRSILRSGGARVVISGPEAVIAGARARLGALVDGLEPGAAPRSDRGGKGWIRQRLADRGGDPGAVYVGFVDPTRQSGTVVLSVPGPGFTDTGDDAILNHLAGVLWSGGGAHGLFIQTWGAGLAYSNGVRPSVSDAELRYYAERCPEIPQTMKFVIDTLRAGHVDAAKAEYAVAQVFWSRAASGYEARAASMAADRVDGRGPEVVQGFREAVLAQRARADLVDQLEARKEPVLGQVLPGYGPKTGEVPGAALMALGPESQLEAWEVYLKAEEGDGTEVQRLYPRDFWIVEAAYAQ